MIIKEGKHKLGVGGERKESECGGRKATSRRKFE
jgi:hypothetical protein